MNNDEMDDAEFDAFLKGEGDLSRRLQALAQPAPSAELDAAILARATVDAAREPRPTAANDPGAANAPTPHLGRLSWRWRVPAGIAATLLVGVVANQTWRVNQAKMEAAAMQEPPPEVMMIQEVKVNAPQAEVNVPSAIQSSPKSAVPTPPMVVAESVMPPPPPAQRSYDMAGRVASPLPAEEAPAAAAPEPVPEAKPAPAPKADTEFESRDKKVGTLAKQPASLNRLEAKLEKEKVAIDSNARAAGAARPPELARPAAPVVAAPIVSPPSPAPSQYAASDKVSTKVQDVTVSGSRNRLPDEMSAQTPRKGIAVVTPAMQLELIEGMLKSGMKKEALEEWTKFRAAYPDYPVSQATLDQIKALKP